MNPFNLINLAQIISLTGFKEYILEGTDLYYMGEAPV